MDMPICFGKRLKYTLIAVTLLSSNVVLAKSQENLIDVKIGVIESLSPKAPSSSDRYKRLYETALFYAIGENEKKINSCGYKFSTSIYYFDSFDAKELIEVTKKLESSNAWVIIGPRRSNQFIVASKTLHSTPIISTMANSEKIYSLDKKTFSMYPSAFELAMLMAKEMQKANYGNNYGTVIDVRCEACIDFAKQFKSAYKGKEAFRVEVGDNTPDLQSLYNHMNNSKIDFLLVPNYSELAGYIISKAHKQNPAIKYIGADGWGENSFSFVQGYGIAPAAQGIAIRVGPHKNEKGLHYNVHSLQTETNGTMVTPPYSVYSLIDLIRTISNDLCESKPKNKQEFAKYLSIKDSSHFKKKNKHAIYSLHNGQLEFSHYLDNQ